MHVHGLHERVVTSQGVEWTVLGPTRYMTNFPFNWPSVLNDSLLLETGGSGFMTCIDPDDVAEVAVKALTEDGHEGQTYRLTSQDVFTAADLAAVLSTFLGREIRVAEGNGERASLAGYFGLVAAGAYTTTNTARQVLARLPRSYIDWLE
jgi:(4-alkanoyl-5-oxo-2,5-dihydrofuran-3-yl)methyl phosphate reductase